MCFSATASYTAAALLIPVGVYGIWHCRKIERPYWMIGTVPLLFGIQQASEGRLWQFINLGDSSAQHTMALMFLLFSHFLWLVWIPFSSYCIETEKRRKIVFLALAVAGAIGGSAIYFPLMFFHDWLTLDVLHHSIVYKINMPHDVYLPAGVDRALYGVVVMVPLLLSSYHHLRVFGVLVVLSMLLSAEVFNYAFVSVWCFFAAILSLYIVTMIRNLQQPNMSANLLKPT